MGDFLITLGDFLVNIGLFFMPISFLAYVLLKFIELAKRPNIHYTKLYKILWLSLQFTIEFSTEKKFIIVVILLILLDIIDLFFEFLEESLDARENSS